MNTSCSFAKTRRVTLVSVAMASLIMRIAVVVLSLLGALVSCQHAPPTPDLGRFPFVPKMDALVERHGFVPLRYKHLEKGEAEIRVWTSGLTRQGHILQFKGDTGLAMYLDQWADEGIWRTDVANKPLVPRRACNWPSLLARLESYGVFELPDADDIPRAPSKGTLDRVMVDGYSVHFEVAKPGFYRTYSYANPTHDPRDPALKPYMDQVLKITQAIRLEFHSPMSSYGERFPQEIGLNQVVLARRGNRVGAFKITDFEFSDSGEESSGELAYEWESLWLTDELERAEDTRQTGTGMFRWNETKAAVPPITVRFSWFEVDLWVLKSGVARVYYPDPDSLEYGQLDRQAVAITELTDFNQIDYLSDDHQYKSAHFDYPRPCDGDVRR